MLKFNVDAKTKPQIYINIGALLDVPTGDIVTGKKGESIINGGLGKVVSIIGPGNSFKSTLLHYMMLSAANKIKFSTPTAMTTYDTEINISLSRLATLASGFDNFDDDVITGEDADWSITDKSLRPAEDWINELNRYTEEKVKNKKLRTTFTAFKDPYTNGPLEVVTPTFVEIDSLSEFEASKTVEMLSKDIDDSSTNTFAMKQGLFKQKFLSSLPRISNSSNTFILTTAHIGEKINMDTGPMAKYQQPTKKLQYLKSGDAVKGVSGKFFFLINTGWYAHTASVLKNQTTRLPEYPLYRDDNSETELNVVRLTMLRSKNGASGYTIELVVSQNEGLLPSLTEFHHIKTNDKFGLEGSNTSYNMIFLPEVKLSRTTVRTKLNENAKLRRAVNIASELLQLHTFQPQLKKIGLLCTPDVLYKDLVDMGYDWENCLLMTREYWIPDQYDTNIKPFLSVIDLLKMRAGQYIPYFLNDDKTVKKEYAHHFDSGKAAK